MADIRALQKEFPQLHLINQNRQVTIIQTHIRDAKSSREDFIFYADRLIRLIVEEGLSFLPDHDVETKTLTGSIYKGVVSSAHIAGVSIMRAGESMEQALRDTCRAVRIGKILIQRNEATADKTPDERYSYSKMPKDIATRSVFLMDPMLATGGSAIRAVECLIKQYQVKEENIIFLNVVCCPEGIKAFCTKYPKIHIVTAAVDECLNEARYILPGLGDFGDRYFGTDN